MTVLRQRMLDDMRIRNLAAETQTSYLRQVAKFARYHGQSPERLGPEDIRSYQLHLIDDRQLAPTSVAGTVAALRFPIRSRSSGTGRSRPCRCRSAERRCNVAAAPGRPATRLSRSPRSAHRRVATHVSELRRRTHDGGRDRTTCVLAASHHRYVMTRPTASAATLRASHDGSRLSRDPVSRRVDVSRVLQTSDFACRKPPEPADRRPSNPSHATALRPRSTAGPIQSP